MALLLLTSKKVKDKNSFKHLKVTNLTININLFKQININQMFDKIRMILMMITSISNNCISRLKKKNVQIHYTLLFKSNTFIRKTKLKLAKNQANAKQHPETELLLF